jgi:hypothetical protein
MRGQPRDVGQLNLHSLLAGWIVGGRRVGQRFGHGAFINTSPHSAKNFALLTIFLPVFLSLPFDDEVAKVYAN